MTRLLWAATACAVCLCCDGCSFQDPEFDGPFQVPRGFVVEPLLPEGQVETLIQLTFDSLGRPVVSRERGHPTILFDNDGDGVFESEKIFSDRITTAHGLWFDGPVLYATAKDSETGETGLFKMEDTDGDGQADTFEKLHNYTGPIGEHGPHDIRRGPDGHPSVMLGNHTFVPPEWIDPLSPLGNYRESQLLPRYMDARGHAVGIMAPGGTLWRLRLGRQRYSLLAGGFRNAFNHAYDSQGDLFTFDSDMEWDVNMPWYRGVRSLHAVPGGDYGWRTGSGKFPPYFLDSLPAVSDLGRGSPVGVEFYHHAAYPGDYFDSFLQADWSRGRIVLTKMLRDGATYRPAQEAVNFVYGEPLNVTDLEVGPDGMVYFTMGGRDTSGGFYRIAYRGNRGNSRWRLTKGIWAAIRQPQPLSSWGYASLEKIKKSLGDGWGADLRRVALEGSSRSADRVRALMLLQRHGPKPNAGLLRPLSKDSDPLVRAAAMYVVGQHGSDRAKAIAAGGVADSDPFVRRRAAEALVRMGLRADEPSFAPAGDLYALLNDRDRFVRFAGRVAIERTPREQWRNLVFEEENPLGAIEGLVALIRTVHPSPGQPDEFASLQQRALQLLGRDGLSAENALRALRAFHLSCSEAQDGCPPEVRHQAYEIAASRFPAPDERLNREYARTMAYADESAAIEPILDAMPPGDENQQLQIHYIYCLRSIKTGWTAPQKKQLLSWFGKALQWRGGASFPGFINRLFDSSLEFFDETEKQAAYAAIPALAPIEDLQAAGRTKKGSKYVPARVFERVGHKSSALSEQEIYEHTLLSPMIGRADARRGLEIFEDQCGRCHRFGDAGKDYGPDLTTLANRFQRADILEAILWPSRTISDQYRSHIIETKNNDLLDGLILSEDDDKLVIMLPEEDRPLSIAKSQITQRRISSVSGMPDRLLDEYGLDQIADLLAYLQSRPQEEAANSAN